MENASLILPILAILVPIYIYVRHDRKIKNQEKKLNDYQLKKFELEDIENKKAQIKGNIITNGGRGVLKVFNTGKSTAHNIRLELLSKPEGIIGLEFDPFAMLNSQESTETSFFLAEGHTSTLKVKYTWNNSYKEDNEFIQVLTI
ncbi:hypothetical protein [Paludibacter jiangxiensis]|uniref:Uncharacterized protein n=1 Tax=Paludibacter jiangxiensis TaxID=681398 RepID=A0A171AP53_9BACT|nr:hypothetical protein [Paludibacter jiangxiensis]GAT64058.1 hypothetical protein PJIAN_4602 [Paludibacter jiangxiensis]